MTQSNLISMKEGELYSLGQVVLSFLKLKNENQISEFFNKNDIDGEIFLNFFKKFV